MVIKVNGAVFVSIKELVSFCDKLKQVDQKAYDSFLDTTADDAIKIRSVDKPSKDQQVAVLPQYNGYTPIFWFQWKQQMGIPVYNKGFRPDINSRFVKEINVPYRQDNTSTKVMLYYNFIKKMRYAVIKE